MILVRTLDTNALVALFLFLVFLVLLLEGCGRIPPEFKAFLELPSDQQHEEIRKFPIDKQIDYYLAGMRYVHPPRIGLAGDIARQGKQALPFLVKRLREDTDELNQVEIMYVFRVMHASYYNLKDEKEVIALLKAKTANMKDSRWKRRGEEMLRFIHENQSLDVEKELDRLNSFNSTGFKDQFRDDTGPGNSPNQVYHDTGAFRAGFSLGLTAGSA